MRRPRIAVECPVCGQRGRWVDLITPTHLLREDRLDALQDRPYAFCATPACKVVYFTKGEDRVFTRADLKVRVGLKETDDPVPVCYCFRYSERMIFDEVTETGKSTIPQKIRAEVRAGNCECEVKNPQGSCCLGDVGRVVKRAKAKV